MRAYPERPEHHALPLSLVSLVLAVLSPLSLNAPFPLVRAVLALVPRQDPVLQLPGVPSLGPRSAHVLGFVRPVCSVDI